MSTRAIKSYPRGSSERVGRYFISSEMDCPCSHCSYTFIDQNLVDGLDRLRDILGDRLIITSGYRCDYYQAHLKEKGFETAKGRSQHQDGCAADVRSDSRSGADLTVFAAEAGFNAIGTGKDWIHVDTRREKERRWTYTT